MKITEARVAALGAIILNTLSTKAQNMSYGADNFYISNNVTVWPICFQTQYHTMAAGNLFIPNSLDRSENNSAIIAGHVMGAVKKQSANLYATKMAEQGFVAVSFDLPFCGGSQGEPRNGVSPDFYVDAFNGAVS